MNELLDESLLEEDTVVEEDSGEDDLGGGASLLERSPELLSPLDGGSDGEELVGALDEYDELWLGLLTDWLEEDSWEDEINEEPLDDEPLLGGSLDERGRPDELVSLLLDGDSLD